MLHMLTCRHAKPFFKKCVEFCNTFLDAKINAQYTLEAVVFNTPDARACTMLPVPARAFMRHAVGQYYAAATKVAMDGVIFVWQ